MTNITFSDGDIVENALKLSKVYGKGSFVLKLYRLVIQVLYLKLFPLHLNFPLMTQFKIYVMLYSLEIFPYLDDKPVMRAIEIEISYFTLMNPMLYYRLVFMPRRLLNLGLSASLELFHAMDNSNVIIFPDFYASVWILS